MLRSIRNKSKSCEQKLLRNLVQNTRLLSVWWKGWICSMKK